MKSLVYCARLFLVSLSFGLSSAFAYPSPTPSPTPTLSYQQPLSLDLSNGDFTSFADSESNATRSCRSSFRYMTREEALSALEETKRFLSYRRLWYMRRTFMNNMIAEIARRFIENHNGNDDPSDDITQEEAEAAARDYFRDNFQQRRRSPGPRGRWKWDYGFDKLWDEFFEPTRQGACELIDHIEGLSEEEWEDFRKNLDDVCAQNGVAF